MEWIAAAILYGIGMCVTYGFIGGIRDEMDGILDNLTILLWPFCLVCVIAYKLLSFFANIGLKIRFLMCGESK